MVTYLRVRLHKVFSEIDQSKFSFPHCHTKLNHSLFQIKPFTFLGEDSHIAISLYLLKVHQTCCIGHVAMQNYAGSTAGRIKSLISHDSQSTLPYLFLCTLSPGLTIQCTATHIPIDLTVAVHPYSGEIIHGKTTVYTPVIHCDSGYMQYYTDTSWSAGDHVQPQP